MSFLDKCVDFILPPRCIVTGELVDQQGMVCSHIWAALNFISDPQCYRCGYPFDFNDGEAKEGNVCAGCLKTPPIFDKARAALRYDDASRDIILAFKHGDQTHAAPSFMPWLTQAGVDVLERADYLVPVPLHRWRLLKRRYNQAALMAQYLSREVHIPFLPDVLIRTRATITQGHLKPRQRQSNVKNAFVVDPKQKEKIRNKHVVVIDDVFTTGATVNECAKALLKNGAASVDVLTLARVVKPLRD